MKASSATAFAHANIALAKYWGKADVEANLPAVPSLSMTLEALSTTTRVEFDAGLTEDSLTINGVVRSGEELRRAARLLDRVRLESQETRFARVESHNNFPTASGLASSASGFAALALAARQASGLGVDLGASSQTARAASASAARSVYGGYVVLPRAAERAERYLEAAAFPLTMLIAVVTQAQKPISSTRAMLVTAETSPYYSAWLEMAPHTYECIKAALGARDLDALGRAMEQSALAMHATMMASVPAILYFQEPTLALLRAVARLRESGIPAYYTMDAGPHVKVLTRPETAQRVASELGRVPGVEQVLSSALGSDARLVTS